jgi:hypothetical protein
LPLCDYVHSQGIEIIGGEAGVPKSSKVNALQKGAGLKAHLKRKGYFERRPHRSVWTILIATALMSAGWCAPWALLALLGLLLATIFGIALAISIKINRIGGSGID